MRRRPPMSTLFPYTTLFRSGGYSSVPGPLIGAIAFEFIRTYANKYAPYAWQMTLGIIMLLDRKSTRLNSSHTVISYAVFCLKKKKARPSQGPDLPHGLPQSV